MINFASSEVRTVRRTVFDSVGRNLHFWSVEGPEDQRRLRLEWSEHGGPGINAAPERTGFGSRLIQRSVRTDLGGKAELTYDPKGLICRIDIRLFGPAPALPD